MPRFMWDFQQGSAQWHQARAGIPTASEFSSVMTPTTMKPSESRKNYACQLIAQRILNWQPDSLERIEHIQRGRENEKFAVGSLELIVGVETESLGFATTDDGRFGASPDRVGGVSADRTSVNLTAEAKCPTIPVQFKRIIFGDDEAYKCQRQGQLWVCEADKAVFVSYCPRTPLYWIEDGRDEHFIAKLADCLERFSDELDGWTEKARSLGSYQPFDRVGTPEEAAYGGRLESEQELEEIIYGHDYRD